MTLAGLKPALLRSALRTLLESPGYNAAVTIVGSSALAMPDLMADAVRDSLPGTHKPLLVYVSPHAPKVLSLLTGRGIPAFSAPESCAVALNALLAHSTWQPAQEVPVERDPVTAALPAGSLDEAQAKQLFASVGITTVHEKVVNSAHEAEAAARELGEKVVLKMLSRTVTHKSDVGGVAVGVKPEEVGARLEAMKAEVVVRSGSAPDAFLVQEMVADGIELILGAHRDALGTAILLGMGGTAAELIQDSTMRLLAPGCALPRHEADTMVRKRKTFALLDGFRGRPRADIEALTETIVAFSRMAAALGERLVTAEINPLFVLAQGRGVRAADGVAVIDGESDAVTSRG